MHKEFISLYNTKQLIKQILVVCHLIEIQIHQYPVM